MPDSKQLRILKKLTAHLAEITPDNGYDFDLEGKVFRGRSILTVDKAQDALSILEFPRNEFWTEVGEHGIVRMERWQLMLQGWPSDDPENPSDNAYRLKAACEHRLGRLLAQKSDGRGPEFPDEYMLGQHEGAYELSSLSIAPGVVRPPEDAASRLAMFYMPLVLGVKVNVASPY